LRLTLITVSFTLFATIILVLVSLVQLQRMARTNLLQSIEFNLHLVSEFINDDLRSLDTLRLFAGAHPQTAEFLLAENPMPGSAIALHTKLVDDFIQNPNSRHLHRLIVMDSDLTRRVQVGTHVDRIAVTVPRLSLLGDLSEFPQSTWLGVHEDPFSIAHRNLALPIISNIYDADSGEKIGYVYLSISPDVILAPLSAYQFPEGGNLFLAAFGEFYKIEDNRFLKSELELINAHPGDDVTINATTEIIAYQNENGTRHLAVFSPLGQTGMSLVQTLPTQLFFQEAVLMTGILLQICIGVLVLGFLVAVYLTWIINRPIVKIDNQLQAIAGGDFVPNPDIEWNNEFGEIGRGVNKLAKDVETLMETRLENEKKKRDLEYKMLQSQINPHFLYNTLNSIKLMASIQSADGIAEMATSLARLLKSIAKSSQTIVPLRQELELLEDYFVISRYRYGGAITMKQSIPSEFLSCNIPIFTLQPLVENAIFHGIEPNNGVGAIEVSAKRTASGDLEITIEDNGIGMDEDSVSTVLTQQRSDTTGLFHQVGLHNVHTRIQYEFGTSYGLRIESEAEKFTRVIALIPLDNESPLQ